ncbi:hypothetical protein E2C01_062154 [Portunus trituberculatus]|uniref:Secreted protein n=1 Tax=Portunus trituberculatus TaxID=210409 RepID=A0A5B7HEC3_PORTR|nr:hypothetical protein [Portunus trituberculatus]
MSPLCKYSALPSHQPVAASPLLVTLLLLSNRSCSGEDSGGDVERLGAGEVQAAALFLAFDRCGRGVSESLVHGPAPT